MLCHVDVLRIDKFEKVAFKILQRISNFKNIRAAQFYRVYDVTTTIYKFHRTILLLQYTHLRISYLPKRNARQFDRRPIRLQINLCDDYNIIFFVFEIQSDVGA